ncbi:dCTP deaminase [uncultured Devosia sp.]|uniref:dCTP deaminase n=1 Tax=uncultured Devosia sp. TaxID=211434 RepID=UPI0035CB7675
MILTDREIRIALEHKAVGIDPLPDLSVAISSTAIDLTLGTSFKIWPELGGVQIRPGQADYSYAKLVNLQKDVPPPFELKPKSFVLAWTAEKVTIPYTSRLAARVEGKSSLARLGISIHVTAPVIHSGFTGQVQLEMFNFGPNTVIFDPGMFVCQLVFEQTAGTPERGYAGMFAQQTQTGLKP